MSAADALDQALYDQIDEERDAFFDRLPWWARLMLRLGDALTHQLHPRRTFL